MYIEHAKDSTKKLLELKINSVKLQDTRKYTVTYCIPIH